MWSPPRYDDEARSGSRGTGNGSSHGCRSGITTTWIHASCDRISRSTVPCNFHFLHVEILVAYLDGLSASTNSAPKRGASNERSNQHIPAHEMTRIGVAKKCEVRAHL